MQNVTSVRGVVSLGARSPSRPKNNSRSCQCKETTRPYPLHLQSNHVSTGRSDWNFSDYTASSNGLRTANPSHHSLVTMTLSQDLTPLNPITITPRHPWEPYQSQPTGFVVSPTIPLATSKLWRTERTPSRARALLPSGTARHNGGPKRVICLLFLFLQIYVWSSSQVFPQNTSGFGNESFKDFGTSQRCACCRKMWYHWCTIPVFMVQNVLTPIRLTYRRTAAFHASLCFLGSLIMAQSWYTVSW